MSRARSDVLDWAAQEKIAQENLRAAMELSGALPDAGRWRLFLDRLLLWMGVVSCAAGVIFFFAFNWAEMGRLAKIGLVQLPLLAALAAAWRLGLDSVAGKAAIFGAAILVGALFALIGQTYQTGADPWELFAVWSAAILPWALVARLPVLWLLCIALADLALALYFQTFGWLFGLLFEPATLIWLLFALNTVALVLWEGLAHSGMHWLRERWSTRLLAVASGVSVTMLAMLQIFERSPASQWGLPVWLAWLAAAYLVYRRLNRDVFVLAGGVLSAIVVVTALIGKHMKFSDAGGFLFMGLLVIGMSAAGGWWLKTIANEETDELEREGA
jgi:uncharacterized membrane protein